MAGCAFWYRTRLPLPAARTKAAGLIDSRACTKETTWWRTKRDGEMRAVMRDARKSFFLTKETWLALDAKLRLRPKSWRPLDRKIPFDWERCLSGREHSVWLSAPREWLLVWKQVLCLASVWNHCSDRRLIQKTWQFMSPGVHAYFGQLLCCKGCWLFMKFYIY